MDTQKAVLLIVAVFVVGMFIGNIFESTGEAVRRRPPGLGTSYATCYCADGQLYSDCRLSRTHTNYAYCGGEWHTCNTGWTCLN